MSTNIEIKTIQSRSYVGIRRVVKQAAIGSACEEIFPRLMGWLGQQQIPPQGPPMVIYHAVDLETGDFDIQPGFFVSESVSNTEDISGGETPAGEALTTTHVGPYEKLPDTWHAIMARAEELGRPVNQACWEIYLNDPREVPPDSLRTEIVVPIDAA